MIRLKAIPQRFIRLQNRSSRTSHHACFACRKQFRKPVDELVQQNTAWLTRRSIAYDAGLLRYPCPQCGQAMTHTGKNFRPPAQDDIESWEIARRLAAEGFRHGRTTGMQYPTKLKDVSEFLERHRRLYGR